MEKTYKMKLGFSYFLYMLGTIAGLTIILIPFGIMMIVFIFKAKVVLKEEEIEYWWLGLKKFRFDDVDSFKASRANGLIGIYMQPYEFKLKSGKTMRIPLGTFKNNQEIKDYIKEKTGISF